MAQLIFATEQSFESLEGRPTVASLGHAVMRTQLDLSGLRTGFSQAENLSQQSLRRMSDSLTSAGRTMSLAVTAPIVGMGAAIVSTAANFESSMNRVRALSQATGTDFERLKRQAQDLGATTVYSASQAADGMSFLAMAGLEVDQIYGAMPSTLQLAAAAQLELADAADIVTNVMTGYNMSVDELENSVDVLTTAFISANTDLRQLGDGMSFAGPVASGLGVAFEEATAAIGLLSNAGIQGGRAGTTLSRILAILSTEGEKLGLTIYDAAGQMLPLADIMEQLEVQGMSSAEVMDFFGQRGGPGMLALLSQGSGALRDYTADLSDVGGTAERVANTQLEGLRGKWVELTSAAEGLRISIGEAGLNSTIQGLVERATDVVRWMDSWDASTKNVVVTVAALAAGVGPLLLGLGGLVRLLPIVATGFAVLSGPAGLITLAAAAVGGLVLALSGKGNSLESSLATARDALAAENSVSLVSALDTVIKNVDGPVRDSLVGLQDELRATGDIGVDMAVRINEALNAAEIAPLQAQLAGLRAEQTALESNLAALGPTENAQQELDDARATAQAIMDAGGEIDAALSQRIYMLEGLAAGMYRSEAEDARLAAAAQARLNENLAEQEEILLRIEGLRQHHGVLVPDRPPVPGSTAPGGGGTTGLTTATSEATGLADALDEVTDSASAADRGLVNYQQRLEGLAAAGREALTSQRELAAILEQRALDGRASLVTRARPDEAGTVFSRDSWAHWSNNRQNEQARAEEIAQLEAARTALNEHTQSLEELARMSREAAAADRERARVLEQNRLARIATAYDVDRAAPASGPTGSEVGVIISTLNSSLRDLELRGVLFGDSLSLANERVRLHETALLEASRVHGENSAVADYFREQLEVARTALERWSGAITRSAEEIVNGKYYQDWGSKDFGDRFAQRGVRGAGRDSLNLEEQGDGFGVKVTDAGDDFAQNVIGAGQSLVGFLSAAQGGNAGGALSAFGGFAGGIASLIPGGAAFAPLISGGFDLLGSLFNLGGSSRSDRQQQAERERSLARSTPAININATVNQTNNYDATNVDPRVQLDNDRRTRDIVLEVLDAIGIQRFTNPTTAGGA